MSGRFEGNSDKPQCSQVVTELLRTTCPSNYASVHLHPSLLPARRPRLSMRDMQGTYGNGLECEGNGCVPSKRQALVFLTSFGRRTRGFQVILYLCKYQVDFLCRQIGILISNGDTTCFVEAPELGLPHDQHVIWNQSHSSTRSCGFF